MIERRIHVYEIVDRYLGTEKYFLIFSNYDQQNKVLYTIEVPNEFGEYEMYFMIVDSSLNYEIEKVQNVMNHQEQLMRFKKENGWHYGFDQ